MGQDWGRPIPLNILAVPIEVAEHFSRAAPHRAHCGNVNTEATYLMKKWHLKDEQNLFFTNLLLSFII